MRPYPNQLVAKLLAMGFSQSIHVTPDEANELYFRDRRDGLKASNIEQMVRVIVWLKIGQSPLSPHRGAIADRRE